MSSIAPRVVVIEDEIHIRDFVCMALENEGCQVYEAKTAAQGLVEAGRRKPDLIILDLGLPDCDGIDVIRQIRAWTSVAILILSARAAENDKIDALDSGADDYLTKPFGVGELLARVRALLRRNLRLAEADAEIVAFGAVKLDLSRRLVERNGAPLHLTPIEYRLLCALLRGAGRVSTHRHLLREVWGPTYSESNHYLRIFVGRLRHKLEINPTQPKHILTETGVGYRFQL